MIWTPDELGPVETRSHMTPQRKRELLRKGVILLIERSIIIKYIQLNYLEGRVEDGILRPCY